MPQNFLRPRLFPYPKNTCIPPIIFNTQGPKRETSKIKLSFLHKIWDQSLEILSWKKVVSKGASNTIVVDFGFGAGRVFGSVSRGCGSWLFSGLRCSLSLSLSLPLKTRSLSLSRFVCFGVLKINTFFKDNDCM